MIIGSPPVILLQPSTVGFGRIGSPFKMVCVARGPAVIYQWQSSTRLNPTTWGEWTNIGGETSSLYTISSLAAEHLNRFYNINWTPLTSADGWSPRKFRCVVTNSSGVVTSSEFTITGACTGDMDPTGAHQASLLVVPGFRNVVWGATDTKYSITNSSLDTAVTLKVFSFYQSATGHVANGYSLVGGGNGCGGVDSAINIPADSTVIIPDEASINFPGLKGVMFIFAEADDETTQIPFNYLSGTVNYKDTGAGINITIPMLRSSAFGDNVGDPGIMDLTSAPGTGFYERCAGQHVVFTGIEATTRILVGATGQNNQDWGYRPLDAVTVYLVRADGAALTFTENNLVTLSPSLTPYIDTLLEGEFGSMFSTTNNSLVTSFLGVQTCTAIFETNHTGAVAPFAAHPTVLFGANLTSESNQPVNCTAKSTQLLWDPAAPP